MYIVIHIHLCYKIKYKLKHKISVHYYNTCINMLFLYFPPNSFKEKNFKYARMKIQCKVCFSIQGEMSCFHGY